MKKSIGIVMGLVFLSAVGLALADDASLQNDKSNLSAKVGNDQKGVAKADDHIGEDTAAINSNNDSIKNEKRRMSSHYENLLKDRAELKEAKASGDQAKIKAKVEDIRRDHRAMYKDSVKLEKERAARKADVKNLKTDRDKRDSDMSKLDSNGQKLDQTNEKIADQKQDSASK